MIKQEERLENGLRAPEGVGMYKATVFKLQLVKETELSISSVRLSTATVVAEAARKYLKGADREHFVIFMLNNQNQIIGLNTVSIGSLSSVEVHPREVFKAAILANAARIILVHNHLSGFVYPSPEDIEITERLKKAGEILGIPVLDHLIISEENHFSVHDRKVINDLCNAAPAGRLTKAKRPRCRKGG